MPNVSLHKSTSDSFGHTGRLVSGKIPGFGSTHLQKAAISPVCESTALRNAKPHPPSRPQTWLPRKRELQALAASRRESESFGKNRNTFRANDSSQCIVLNIMLGYTLRSRTSAHMQARLRRGDVVT